MTHDPAQPVFTPIVRPGFADLHPHDLGSPGWFALHCHGDSDLSAMTDAKPDGSRAGPVLICAAWHQRRHVCVWAVGVCEPIVPLSHSAPDPDEQRVFDLPSMRIVPLLLFVLAVLLAVFAYWGIFTRQGAAMFDEMAGMIPMWAAWAALACFVAAGGLWWWQNR